MHGSSLARMSWFVDTYLSGSHERIKVLDIGSMEVAGGSYRQFFPSARFAYEGLDLAPGPNVDIVPQLPYWWPEISSGAYDAVISGQALEHMEFFWLAAAEMARVLRPHGLMCLIAPRGFARHRYPVDCWRFDADGMLALARYCNLEPLHVSCDMQPAGGDGSWHIEACEDAMLVAGKPENWPGVIDASRYSFQEADMEALAGDFIPCPQAPQMETVPSWEYEKLRDSSRDEKSALEWKVKQKDEELAALRRVISGYEKSRSWRITRPLRMMTRALRWLRRK